ncbi:MAG: response regulator [Polyangiaceae bacterium]|nr:response regulator [Polyangiaceae bacterium]
MTVLVIDDSEIARSKMEAILEDAGMHVIGLPSPIGATRAMLSNRVDVVVIDVLMPAMRGDRLAALFRSNPRFKNIGVILVSGAAETELQSLALEVQAEATISKSQLDQLVATVQDVKRRMGTA